MKENRSRLLQIALLFIGIILVVVFFIPTPGTGNTDTWVRWAKESVDLGLVKSYAVNHDTYPPVIFMILFLAGKISVWFNIWIYTAVKCFVAAFLILTTLLTLWMTRNVFISLIMLVGLLINGVALGHLDVFFAPMLVLALWALKENKLILFTIAFCLSFLVKWQPLILGPFIALYIFNIHRLRDWKAIPLKRILLRIIVPVLVLAAAFFLSFGAKPVIDAFVYASDHHYLSGNALNINWILTHFLHVYNPAAYGPLVHGQAEFIKGAPLNVKLVPKLFFFLIYAITLVKFFTQEKTFRNFLLFALLGYWAYFTLNTGVHENHLYIGVILAVLLFWVEREQLLTMLMILLIANFNYLVFNGLDGAEITFPRVFMGTDMALIISIFNVIVFFIYWVIDMFRKDKRMDQGASDISRG